jgi:uncharacterized membrane protein/glutaredoxin
MSRTSRRRETPWIQRNSRYLIAAIASVGALGTAYLTILKLSGGAAACAAGCGRVLSSPYATVFGLPLTLFGFLAYAGMGVMALAPLAINPEKNRELRQNLETWTWQLLFVGAAAMTVFSGYLMYLLAARIQAVCLYCITSAVLSVSLLSLTLLGNAWKDVGQVFFMGILVSMVTLVGTLGVYANVNDPATADTTATTIPGEPGEPITTTSSEAEIALAQHLTQIEAKMYGAWWCPHCHDQKQLFGQEAASQIIYIECAPDGQNPQTALCQANSDGVKGYPTWEINGQYYGGTQSLEQLADASGYQGPRSFKN